MSDQFQQPPYLYDGFEPAEGRKSVFEEASEVAASLAHYVVGAIESARKPGMPLSLLSNVTREAPLGSLAVAFMLGVAVSRRRSSRR